MSCGGTHIACKGKDACRNSTHACPAGEDCTVTCSGYFACSEMMLDGRVVHYDILEEIYAEINARFGSNAQVPRRR